MQPEECVAVITALCLVCLLLAYTTAVLVAERFWLRTPKTKKPDIPTAEPIEDESEPWEEDPDKWKRG